MQSRRTFLKAIGMGAAAIAATPLAQAASKPKPNIIFILADDAGYGDFGCYGQKMIQTPQIDQMAKEGLRFTDHYAGDTVCAPSRCSLLTGLHTGHTYIRGNKELQPEGQQPIPADTVTIAKLMKGAGYTTGIVGKWGLGGPGTAGVPNKQGFDFWYGYLCQRQAHSYYPPHIWKNEEKIILEGNKDGQKNTWSHDLLAKEALGFIRDNKDKPFFLYVPFTIPHAQMQIPDDAPYTDKDWPQVNKNHAAMITRMDKDVGRIVDLVKELGLAENTLIMFSSDNGPHGEGGANPKFFNGAGPLRGMKRDLYEGGIRVPLVALWPGTIKPDTTTALPSAFWDFMPTLCDLAGIKTPEKIDGISFLPTLLGKRKEQKKHEYLYWEFSEKGGKQAVRLGKWKGIRLGVLKNPNGPVELYNLEDDLGEKKDIAKENPKVVARIEGIMRSARTTSQMFPLWPQPKSM